MEGLNEKEVIDSRNKYGTNKLKEIKENSFFKLMLESLGDPIIKILLIALGIKVIFLIKSFDWYETVGIVIAIFLASFISTVSEYGSEKAFKKMQEESSKIKCKVIRNSKTIEIPIDDIVVNDIVIISSGDKIPADGIVVDGSVSVDESVLNGESKEKYKNKNDKLYRGSIVSSGMGKMLVKKVGINTFYGKLSIEIQEKMPESPLKIRLRGLAKVISKIGYVGAFFVFFSYLFSVIFINNNFDMVKVKELITNFPVITGHILYALTLAVTIIVVAVPEGLPMMITLVLSSNMKRMLKNNVLVRKMMGIETAGSINMLFTDKTGTLTKGKLEVIRFVSPTLKEYDSETDLSRNKRLYEMVKKSFVLNNEAVYSDGKIIGGNITDRALLKFIDGKNVNDVIEKRTPFDSKNKYSKVELASGYTLIKGATEKILPKCNYYYDDDVNKRFLVNKSKLLDKISDVSKRGIRVLCFAVAYKNENYILLGFAYIKDEIRIEAKEGIKLVKDAGIRTIMLTGDNKDTAYAIGNELELIEEGDLVITSDELNSMENTEIMKILPKLRIVARSLPQDKSKLVKISEQSGYVVGMTGDGVNDAPALKHADVGFSMGSGTEIAKEASDIVILDDNFLSISKAILYGRTIFKSIRKFIILQLTANFCALSLSIIGPFIGVNTPVTVIQMLWINMVMDTLSGLAFSFEPALLEYMKEKPKKKDEAIINKYMINEIAFTGIYSAILCILFLKLPVFRSFYRMGTERYFMTAFFALLIFIDVFNAFNARTYRLNLLSNLRKNKVFMLIILLIVIIQIIMIYYGGSVFRTSGLTLKELGITILLASTVIPVDNTRKLLLRLRGIKGGV